MVFKGEESSDEEIGVLNVWWQFCYRSKKQRRLTLAKTLYLMERLTQVPARKKKQ